MEGFMGYLICVKHFDGKTYCWNDETEQIEEIWTKPIEVDKCPEKVLSELLKRLGREAKKMSKE